MSMIQAHFSALLQFFFEGDRLTRRLFVPSRSPVVSYQLILCYLSYVFCVI